jgi:primosomal protein N' (replication factor Y)
MVAKGLDFGRVTLVGVISADTQMLLPDFRASERTFQLLTQVAGRAGRSTLLGEVVIQTHIPGHYTLAHVIDHDFRAFYAEEVRDRQETGYPPFSRMALIEIRGTNEANVEEEAGGLAAALRRAGGGLDILGPAPAVIGRIKREFRWHVLVKSPKKNDPGGILLHRALREVSTARGSQRPDNVRLTIDIDPVGLL